jgi:hypothetical protein
LLFFLVFLVLLLAFDDEAGGVDELEFESSEGKGIVGGEGLEDFIFFIDSVASPSSFKPGQRMCI